MPKIKIDKIISFSTEDQVHTALNLLSSDTSKKWKCKDPGERSASVVIQLDKACVISSIDIGNEHSAYIEVLAGRSSSNDDFKVLVVMSSFMTPLDSRQSQNVNKVRMFSNDQLSQPECLQKWDRIKIICTQPFNKHVQYGLSFVTFYSNEDAVQSSMIESKIGNFKIRPESPDTLSIGSLFARRKESPQPLKGAAAIREASSNPPSINCKSPLVRNFPKTSKTDSEDYNESSVSKERNRNDILYTAEDDESNHKIDKIIEQKKVEDDKKKAEGEKRSKEEEKRKEEKKVKCDEKRAKGDERRKVEDDKRKKEEEKHKTKKDKSPKTPKTKDSPTRKNDSTKRKHRDSSESPGDTPSTSKKLRNNKMKKNRVFKPYNKLLEGVVFVISGIQNPGRNDLRAAALAMGAKYKSDWDKSCTHLICAFRNTPKFLQVKGKGKIVTKDWVKHCNDERKRLPWRRYALDRKDRDEDESEEEIFEEQTNTTKHNIVNQTNSDEDTEDEIERIQALAQNVKKQNIKIADEVMSVGDNNEDPEMTSVPEVDKLPCLADFFAGIKFFIDKLNLPESDVRQLNQYIVAYKGEIIGDFEDADNIMLVTNSDGASKYLPQCTETLCMSPDWVWDCHNKQKLLSTHNFNFT